jgi:diacylglycerol kinase (ATP)
MPNNKHALKSVGGWTRIGNAMRYSVQGLRAAFVHEAAFRQELMLLAPTLSALWWAQLPKLETLLIIALAVGLLVVELLNSAIETLTDRVSTEMHPLAGRTKDIASAAVFLALWLYIGVWCALVAPALWARWM